MGSKEAYYDHLNQFADAFHESDEFVAFQEADKNLYCDPSMIRLSKQKEAIEKDISIAYLLTDSIENNDKRARLMEEYQKTLSEINSLACVVHYYECYEKIRDVKYIFEEQILRKLM